MKLSRVARILISAMWICLLNSAWALSPDAELDRCLLAAEKYIAANDFSHAEIYLQKIAALKIPTPADYDFFVAVVRMQQHEDQAAQAAFDRYVQHAGKNGKYYKDALEQLTLLEERQTQTNAAAVSSQPGGPAKRVSAEVNAEPVATASGLENPDASYDAKLKQQYQRGDTVNALIARINELLASHVFVASKIKNPQTQDSELFSVSIAQKNEVVVTRQSRTRRSGQLQSNIKIDRLDVFGVNPYIDYVCDRIYDSCWIRHPATGSQWIVLENNEAVAAELSKALTRLMKALQRPTG